MVGLLVSPRHHHRGVIYGLGLGGLAVMGQFTMPPSQPAQLFGAILTITLAPVIVILLACVHHCAPEERKAWSLSGLAFAVLFAAMVSINRYVQLTVIRQGLASGSVDQLQLFLPYGNNSIMLSLEILGWGFFLSLAALCAAMVFNGGGLERWLRALFIAYGLLGLTSALGLVVASPITALGFVAWGPVLDVIAALLGVWFWRRAKAPRSTST
ncbi:MAG TPA: hypothetical protein VGL40_13475 [Bacillota bacterium]